MAFSPKRRKTVAAAIGIAALGGIAINFALPPAPAQALTVFDPSNYAQNLMTASRTLQQVNQQIQSLQNEAQMLIGMGKNLSRIDFPQLDAIRQTLTQIDRLMGQAQGIDFRVGRMDEQFRQLFPDAFDQALRSDARIRDARGRLEASSEAFRQTMTVQSQVVENIHADAEALDAIVARSQGAEGSLQAQQATNQLLALTAKQQFQLQQLMAAQFRSQAVEEARRATQSLEARAATKKFIGSGSAYTPH